MNSRILYCLKIDLKQYQCTASLTKETIIGIIGVSECSSKIPVLVVLKSTGHQAPWISLAGGHCLMLGIAQDKP
jgi:hypothetical protein